VLSTCWGKLRNGGLACLQLALKPTDSWLGHGDKKIQHKKGDKKQTYREDSANVRKFHLENVIAQSSDGGAL
jgi:hypothetical protein